MYTSHISNLSVQSWTRNCFGTIYTICIAISCFIWAFTALMCIALANVPITIVINGKKAVYANLAECIDLAAKASDDTIDNAAELVKNRWMPGWAIVIISAALLAMVALISIIVKIKSPNNRRIMAGAHAVLSSLQCFGLLLALFWIPISVMRVISMILAMGIGLFSGILPTVAYVLDPESTMSKSILPYSSILDPFNYYAA